MRNGNLSVAKLAEEIRMFLRDDSTMLHKSAPKFKEWNPVRTNVMANAVVVCKAEDLEAS